MGRHLGRRGRFIVAQVVDAPRARSAQGGHEALGQIAHMDAGEDLSRLVVAPRGPRSQAGKGGATLAVEIGAVDAGQAEDGGGQTQPVSQGQPGLLCGHPAHGLR